MLNSKHFSNHFEIDVLHETRSLTIDVGALTQSKREELQERLTYMGWDIVEEKEAIWTVKKTDY